MKTTHVLWLTLATAAALLSQPAAGADTTNCLSLSARIGFNVSARFKGLDNNLALPLPVATRTTPRGDAYNYADGYVLTDISGNAGGQTWYWGYDNSSRQISGNNILLSRTTGVGQPSTTTAEDNPQWGGEMMDRFLFRSERGFNYGLEAAINYTRLSMSDNSPLLANLNRLTYPFAFTPGTTPPAATPAAPYQGSYEGPGFVISDTPGAPFPTTVPGGAVVVGSRELQADLWGVRLGPCLEVPLSQQFDLSVSAGLAAAVPDVQVSWNEAALVNGAAGARLSGSGSGSTLMVGWYAGANLAWQISEKWSAIAGVQFQDVGTYNHSFGGRDVELNLSSSIFVTLGIGYSF
jgi:hypothetical protein